MASVICGSLRVGRRVREATRPWDDARHQLPLLPMRAPVCMLVE